MIGGQYRDITGDDADLEELHRLKTGRLFVAAVRMGLGGGRGRHGPSERAWLAFGDDVGLLFQVVDDLLDGDGYADASRSRGGQPAGRSSLPSARARGSTSSTPTRACSRELVDALAVRTS